MRRKLGDRREIGPAYDIVGDLWGTLETVLRLPLRNVGPGGALLESHVPLPAESVHRLTFSCDGQERRHRCGSVTSAGNFDGRRADVSDRRRVPVGAPGAGRSDRALDGRSATEAQRRRPRRGVETRWRARRSTERTSGAERRRLPRVSRDGTRVPAGGADAGPAAGHQPERRAAVERSAAAGRHAGAHAGRGRSAPFAPEVQVQRMVDRSSRESKPALGAVFVAMDDRSRQSLGSVSAQGQRMGSPQQRAARRTEVR